MCLSTPAKVFRINGKMAKVKIGNSFHEIDLTLNPSVKTGDYVLVQNNFAIKKISKKEAKETLKIIDA